MIPDIQKQEFVILFPLFAKKDLCKSFIYAIDDKSWEGSINFRQFAIFYEKKDENRKS